MTAGPAGGQGPLAGLRVLELAGLGPAPFAGMVLADLGADVLRVERPADAARPVPPDPLLRGRRRVGLDLKDGDHVASLLALADRADVLVEPFRPGVAERLGLGPDVCLRRNPGLVYARMTGWGQTGPLAQHAGHDIDYIAVAGVLDPLRREGGRPHAPVNLLGDFGGGGMLLVVGVLAALHERRSSGRGQVVDAAMVDGAALLSAFVHGLRAMGMWPAEPGGNLLDGGAPFYDTYTCADGRFVAVGAIEPPFYAALLDGLGIDPSELPPQLDTASWPAVRQRFAAVFATRTREEWQATFAGTDACVAPVLTPWEAPEHEHNRSRGVFVALDGRPQPAPAPRFGRTPAPPPSPTPAAQDVAAALAAWDAGA